MQAMLKNAQLAEKLSILIIFKRFFIYAPLLALNGLSVCMQISCRALAKPRCNSVKLIALYVFSQRF